MHETNSLSTKQLLERMDRRDSRMERVIRENRQMIRENHQNHQKLIHELASIQKGTLLLLNRMDDRISTMESS